MKLKKIYEMAIEEGIKTDPRGKAAVVKILEKKKKEFLALTSKQKSFFDKEGLLNPYADSRLLFGDPEKNITTVLVGIDIDTSELLLADRLNSKFKDKIDLVIAHHPQGTASAGFCDVMDMQADIFCSQGVPVNICEKMVQERKSEVKRRIHSANHQRTADAARLLGIPLLCVHTPADNHVENFLTEFIKRHNPETLEDVLNLLETIEEYRIAREQKAGPHVLFGNLKSRTGKIFVDMTGGTEGPKMMFEKLSLAGIGTIIGMHFSEEHYKELKDKNMNCIVAGHSASDNLGINLLLDKIEKIQKIKIIPCSGFRRVKR
jgi:putative NIF3 family GTP cyclohydrolase 1 type 2